MNPPADGKRLAATFGIELNPHGFCKVNPFAPSETKPARGLRQRRLPGADGHPRVGFRASGAGPRCGELWLPARQADPGADYPPEKEVAAEEPRIGVFVCHCGANIGRIVDVPATVDYARTLPNVVYAQEQLFSCASNCAKEITDWPRKRGSTGWWSPPAAPGR
jgi:heterodisulfide reductase subunit A2